MKKDKKVTKAANTKSDKSKTNLPGMVAKTKTSVGNQVLWLQAMAKVPAVKEQERK